MARCDYCLASFCSSGSIAHVIVALFFFDVLWLHEKKPSPQWRGLKVFPINKIDA
ncbi:Conserved hypothetical protein [Prochlorococcus marinus str. MIT 9303]|uniref:Uncharacterized protein n=1 Tax=Prochlorococcus marinus (strain MIT 9303) TaxID=59922 RepID=A2C7Y2_PROM3|nr:Conserved hypothetical protein [Prochlorococcus marinus str. MIT 9303]